VQAARRYLADPPGPTREAAAPTGAVRWLTGRRGVLTLVGGSVAVGLVLGLVIVLVTRS
jgi:hypothetical protein